MALLVVFGIPGVGKSFVGRILQQQFNFYHYDADADLTPEMITAIKEEKVFTQTMRDKYFTIVSQKLTKLLQQHKNIVVSQALIKETNRLHIANKFPQAQLIHVTANINNIHDRIKIRDNWVSIEYADKIRKIFEKPKLPHFNLDNNYDDDHIIQQLQKLLKSHHRQ